MKRLVKGEFYTFLDYKGGYDVYKKPTDFEIQILRKSSGNNIRGVIDKGNQYYIWDGEMGHKGLNNWTDQYIPLDYFRFSWEQGYDFTFHLSGLGASIDTKECMNIIRNNLDFLSRIGNLDAPILICGLTDTEGKRISSTINEFINEE